MSIKQKNKELENNHRRLLLLNLERFLYTENLSIMKFKEKYQLKQDKSVPLLIGHKYGEFGFYQGVINNPELTTFGNHLFFRIEKDEEGYNIVNFISYENITAINDIVEQRRLEIDFPDCGCNS